jgi:hypothetical protein
MAPKLTEDEIDDLIYFSRAGEQEDLTEAIKTLAERENASPAEIVAAAQDASNKSTCLHMATGNGHLGTFLRDGRFTISFRSWDWDLGS